MPERCFKRAAPIDELPTMSAYLNLAVSLYETKNCRKAIPFLELGLGIAIKRNQKWFMAAFNENLGVCSLINKNTRLANNYIETAFILHNEIDNTKGKGNSLGNLANIAAINGDINKAIELNKRALEQHKLAKSVIGQARDLQNISSAYKWLGELSKSEKALLKADKLLTLADVRDKIHGQVKIALGTLYWEQKKYVNAISALQDIEKYFTRDKGYGIYLYYMGSSYYRSRKNNDKAIQYLSKAVDTQLPLYERKLDIPSNELFGEMILEYALSMYSTNKPLSNSDIEKILGLAVYSSQIFLEKNKLNNKLLSIRLVHDINQRYKLSGVIEAMCKDLDQLISAATNSSIIGKSKNLKKVAGCTKV